jgi:hypothetical protein
MATKKYVGENALLYLWGKIKTLVGTKVDKVEGKGLSTNDYTSAEKTKLGGIATGAQVNVIENVVVNGTSATIANKTATITMETGAIDQIKVNGVAQPIEDKAVDIAVPTKTSDLTNDSNFAVDASYIHTDNNFTNTLKTKLDGITAGAEPNVIATIKVNNTAQTVTDKTVNISVPTNTNQLTNGANFQTDTQVQAAINSALEGITGIDFQVVQSLPATGTKGVIYLMSNGSSAASNIYDEYIWLSSSSSYEKIGTTQVDLTNYVQFSDLVELTNGEIDNITNN